jgi:hypothetical protein
MSSAPSGKHARRVIDLLTTHVSGLTKRDICSRLDINERQFENALAFIREFNVVDDGLLLVCMRIYPYRYSLERTKLPAEEYSYGRLNTVNTHLRRIENHVTAMVQHFPADGEVEMVHVLVSRLREDVDRLAARRRTDGTGVGDGSVSVGNGNGNGGNGSES